MSVEEQREELQRVLQSPQFRRAPKLQKLLTLVCTYYFENRGHEINEFLIAAEAFGKGSQFDPGQDSIVRVQAREARRRLREYYQGEGKDSRLVLDIPVGTYAPVFTPIARVPAEKKPRTGLNPGWGVLGVCALVVAAIILSADIGWLQSGTDHAAASAGKTQEQLGRSLAGLWGRFLESDAPTILVLSNPAVSTACSPPPGLEPGVQYPCPDEFTGMGEAMALHLVTDIFKGAREKLAVKQSRVLTDQDVRRSNLILLGGRRVNPWTAKLSSELRLPATNDFASSLADPAEKQAFVTAFDSKTGELTRDRGILALRKNPATNRWLLFLYGGHSQGTQAVVEAATDERFLSKLNWPASGRSFPDSFQVLIGVAVDGKVRRDVAPVAVRVP